MIPKAFIQNINLLERSLIRSFRKYANAGAFDDKSEWYVLAVAQHNGLPTRCLDWAASPLIAAHFACGDESRRNADGAIWCLHAGALREINRTNNSTTGALSGVAWVYDTRLLEKSFFDLDALNATLDKQKHSSKLMLLWEPPSLDARIANQSGLLSIMNDAGESPNEFLETYCQAFPDLVFRIVIEASGKSEVRDMLDQNNISERMLFPGLPGLCTWLKRYYGKAW
jgi:FRG domain